MAFADDMNAFVAETKRRVHVVHTVAVLEGHRSFQSGSEITGAPGQPVDFGNLFRSVLVTEDEALVSTIASNSEYALPVEEGVGPHGSVVYGAKNGIGGSHSIKMTVAAWDRIVEHANAVAGGG